MRRSSRWPVLISALACLAVAPSPAQQPPPAPPLPRLEPIAETRLVMEGLALANFRGLDRLLRQRPADVESWVFVRGQALLIAETGNLLLLRPPLNAGERLWMERATQLRESATELGRLAAAQDYPRARQALKELANACTRCHQSFRVPIEVTPSSPAGL